MYDITTGATTRITSDPTLEKVPAIYGSKIVFANVTPWWRADWQKAGVYVYDIETQQFTKISGQESIFRNYNRPPDIYENTIVWSEPVGFMRPDRLHIYNLETKTDTIVDTIGAIGFGCLSIFRDKIVWVGTDLISNKNGIYLYDITTGEQSRISSDAAEPWGYVGQDIHEGGVVWSDFRSGTTHDIYLYQIKDGAPPPPPNQPPVALFTFWPENPKAGEEIYFDASSSYDPDSDGSIVRYEWDWDGDGVYDDSLESATASMQWPLGGSFTVRLRVIDDSGAEAVFTAPLLVSDTPKSELAAFIIFAFRDAGNTRLWQNILFDTPVIWRLFPSYWEFRKIDEWLREDALGNISGVQLDWLKNDQRFEEFSQYDITPADIITLLHEKIPNTDVSYKSRILTTISEYRTADYALLMAKGDSARGLKRAMGIFNELGRHLLKWVPIVGELIVGDSTVNREVLKEAVKVGTRVAAEEVLIRKGFEEAYAKELSGSGVNLAWTAYKAYKGINDLIEFAKFRSYEERLSDYFTCLWRKDIQPFGDGDCWEYTIKIDTISKVLEDEDRQEFDEMWQRYGGTEFTCPEGVCSKKLEELQNTVKIIILDALEQHRNKLPDRLHANANSPVEVRVIDSYGVITGVVDGIVRENIPRSVYDGDEEVVTIVLPSSGNSFQLVGTADGTYGFVVTSVQEGISRTFRSIDIPTNKGVAHQYFIDWQALSQGEKGVTLQMDADGDGVFEQTIKADATLQPPTADINGPYEGNEGYPIIFDAPGSSDPDGEIILYEWDFDGDGIYDIASTSPTAEHIWGDDYQGEIILRITDDEGLTDTAATSVIVKNVAPIISNLSVNGPTHPNQEIWAGDGLNFSGDFADDGWLDTHTAEWNFGDETTAIGAITQENNPPAAIGQVAGNHIYYNAGTYTITLAVTDDDGGVSANTFQIAVKPIPAAIDCNPETLNLKSGGKWITCYIELPAGYDVRQIDGSTVFLNGAIPIYLGKEGWAKPESNKANIMDHDEDGILERMVKFDREAVQDILKPEEAAILTVAGKVFYNQGLADFEGQDTIRVIDKGKTKI
ncbi:PKD domain-containing protein [Candidatus Parcubacteria bacterium]|nr:PKD domain-containing protein [Candidatus Parcubacteria bacterium]